MQSTNQLYSQSSNETNQTVSITVLSQLISQFKMNHKREKFMKTYILPFSLTQLIISYKLF